MTLQDINERSVKYWGFPFNHSLLIAGTVLLPRVCPEVCQYIFYVCLLFECLLHRMTTDMIMHMILLLTICFAKLPLVEFRLSVLRKLQTIRNVEMTSCFRNQCQENKISIGIQKQLTHVLKR